jgi:ribokinase
MGMGMGMGRIFNLGSLNVDHVYRVHHIASSGETVSALDHQTHPGGKGLNQSLASALAGADVLHAGCVGADGGFLVEWLGEAGVDTSLIARTGTPSGQAMIQVDDLGRNALVISGGANLEISKSLVRETLDRMTTDDWLLLQNEVNDLGFVLAEAAKRSLSVAFNVAPADHRVNDYEISRVSLLIVNAHEAAALTGGAAPEGAIDELARKLPDATIILTLGREGLLTSRAGRLSRLPAHRVEAVDETAAGDAFIGHLMAEIVSGASLDRSLARAQAAGALAVTVAGAAPSIPSRDEVDRFLASR